MAIAVQFRLRNIEVKNTGHKRVNSMVVFSTVNKIWARAGIFFHGSITEESITDSTFWGVASYITWYYITGKIKCMHLPQSVFQFILAYHRSICTLKKSTTA